jgi:hypothetical protein
MALVGVVDVPAALPRELDHLGFGVVTDRSEAIEARDIEVHGATSFIREATIEHHADEAADVGDRRRRSRRRGDREGIEGGHVTLEASFLTGGQIEIVDAELARLGEQRVVDVGDVADALDRVALVEQMTLQDVVRDERRRMPEVGCVVGRDPAGVHEHVLVGLERDDRLARRVVETEAGHAQPSIPESSGQVAPLLLIPLDPPYPMVGLRLAACRPCAGRV